MSSSFFGLRRAGACPAHCFFRASGTTFESAPGFRDLAGKAEAVNPFPGDAWRDIEIELRAIATAPRLRGRRRPRREFLLSARHGRHPVLQSVLRFDPDCSGQGRIDAQPIPMKIMTCADRFKPPWAMIRRTLLRPVQGVGSCLGVRRGRVWRERRRFGLARKNTAHFVRQFPAASLSSVASSAAAISGHRIDSRFYSRVETRASSKNA